MCRLATKLKHITEEYEAREAVSATIHTDIRTRTCNVIGCPSALHPCTAIREAPSAQAARGAAGGGQDGSADGECCRGQRE